MSAAAARVMIGDGGVVHQAPANAPVIGQWVMYPEGDDETAVGIGVVEFDGTFILTVLRLPREVGEEIVERGMERADPVDPMIVCELPVYDGGRAVHCGENIARATVIGRLPMYPFNDEAGHSWKAVVALCVTAEERVN